MRGFIRKWKEFDLKEVEKNLLVIGELSSECFSCHTIGIDSSAQKCPECGIEFKFVAFRRRVTPNYLRKLRDEFPSAILIDFDDFKRAVGKRDARNLLDL